MAGIGWAQKCWALAQLRTLQSSLTTPLTEYSAYEGGHAPSMYYYMLLHAVEYADADGIRYVRL
jgi:hypothetical protein